MRNIKLSFLIFTVAVLAGCATAPPVPFEGESHANPRLASDTYAMISMITAAQGCASIDKIHTSIVESPSGEPGKKNNKEKWLAYGCDNTYGYEVSFIEDGVGGAYFSVSNVSI